MVISGLYADSSNPQVREMAYRIFLHPDPNQDKILTQLLASRHSLARTCGFDNYSERALKGSILSSPNSVLSLLDAVSEKIKTKADKDFHEMATLKKTLEGQHLNLAVWDVPYLTQKAKRDQLEVTSKEYSPYLSLGACMEGLNIIFR